MKKIIIPILAAIVVSIAYWATVYSYGVKFERGAVLGEIVVSYWFVLTVVSTISIVVYNLYKTLKD